MQKAGAIKGENGLVALATMLYWIPRRRKQVK